jgi:hypothetical protein
MFEMLIFSSLIFIAFGFSCFANVKHKRCLGFCVGRLMMICCCQKIIFSNSFEGGTWGCEKIWEGGPLFLGFIAFL